MKKGAVFLQVSPFFNRLRCFHSAMNSFLLRYNSECGIREIKKGFVRYDACLARTDVRA
jgi:hypothetical protein